MQLVGRFQWVELRLDAMAASLSRWSETGNYDIRFLIFVHQIELSRFKMDWVFDVADWEGRATTAGKAEDVVGWIVPEFIVGRRIGTAWDKDWLCKAVLRLDDDSRADNSDWIKLINCVMLLSYALKPSTIFDPNRWDLSRDWAWGGITYTKRE